MPMYVCMHVYVCMCVCMHATHDSEVERRSQDCADLCEVSVNAYVCMHACECVWMCVCTTWLRSGKKNPILHRSLRGKHEYLCMYACMQACMFVVISTTTICFLNLSRACISPCMHVCEYVCMYACMQVLGHIDYSYLLPDFVHYVLLDFIKY